LKRSLAHDAIRTFLLCFMSEILLDVDA